MSVSGSIVVSNRGASCHVPLVFQCIYGRSDEGGENGDGKDGSEISEGGERVEITWPLV